LYVTFSKIKCEFIYNWLFVKKDKNSEPKCGDAAEKYYIDTSKSLLFGLEDRFGDLPNFYPYFKDI